jgi:hypothetical protein
MNVFLELATLMLCLAITLAGMPGNSYPSLKNSSVNEGRVRDVERCNAAGSLPPKRVGAIVNAYTSAFFQQILLDIPSPLLTEEARSFSEATLQIWRPSEAPVNKS